MNLKGRRLRQIFVIGIGAGDPEHLTIQAVRALNKVDVVFAMDKGTVKNEFVRLRRAICETYITDRPYRFVEASDPVRDSPEGAYGAGVARWHEDRAGLYERLIRDELGQDGCGAFLVWGDPSLYDSTLRILDSVRERGAVAFGQTIVPGISSAQVLAARHGTVLNAVGAPVHITTGRRLNEEGLPADLATGASTLVMLDGDTAFRHLPDQAGLEICWGAYLGMPDEILIRGRLSDVAERIETVRAKARAAKGWIMDVYLLRRTDPP